MNNRREKLDDFLRFNERDVLPDASRVSREDADRRALQQYELFRQQGMLKPRRGQKKMQ